MDLVINGKHLGLENLYRMVQFEPARGTEIVENYLKQLIESDTIGSTPLPLSVAKSRIMPRIQPISIFKHLNQQQVAYIPFVNNTVVVFVIDMPYATTSITVEQLLRWGISHDDIDQIARQNLASYKNHLEIKFIKSNEGGRAAIVSTQDGYDTARLLLTTLHKRLAPELRGNFYVATPGRDVFLALTCDPPIFVDRLKKRVVHDFKRVPYPISDEFFIVTKDGIAGTIQEEV